MKNNEIGQPISWEEVEELSIEEATDNDGVSVDEIRVRRRNDGD